MRHSIEWIIAFLEGCIVTKIPMRREYEVNWDVCPFTHGNGALAVATSAGNTVLPRNRTGSENLTLAIPSPHSIPWHHGNPAGITTRGVGMDPTRGASLYSGAGSACGDLDIHGPRVTGAGRHVAGTAAPDVTEFFPPPIERSATASTSTSPTGSTPSWRSTGPSWLYAHPDTCGRRR